MTHSNTQHGKDANRDPITKAPGSHPVGTAVGGTLGGIAGGAAAAAAAGAATGAAAGSTLGPAGTIAGIAVGAVVGGLAGKGVAEKIDPTGEDAYWREAHRNEPYYNKEYGYEDYSPAYRVGSTGYAQYEGQTFEEAEDGLRSDYEEQRGKSKLGWDRAKDAVLAGWNRVANTFRDDDHKGK